jgi:SAM-dependent methyltransferase
MNLKRIAHYVLPQIVFDVTRPMRQMRALRAYRRNRLHDYGYILHRQRVFKQAISDSLLLERMRGGEPLPLNYGVDVDERCVEFPWTLAQLGSDPEVVLDAGSTLNHDYIVSWPGLANKSLYLLTLAPEPDCFWWRGISYLYADLRSIPLRDNYCDTITCMSVLEHIGFDNTVYTLDNAYREHNPDDFMQAIAEMRRVLRPGGRLLLTVPYGRYERHDWFQQFDCNLLSRALDAFGPAQSVRVDFFRNTPQGWYRSTDEGCCDARYGEIRGAGAVACALIVT